MFSAVQILKYSVTYTVRLKCIQSIESDITVTASNSTHFKVDRTEVFISPESKPH